MDCFIFFSLIEDTITSKLSCWSSNRELSAVMTNIKRLKLSEWITSTFSFYWLSAVILSAADGAGVTGMAFTPGEAAHGTLCAMPFSVDKSIISGSMALRDGLAAYCTSSRMCQRSGICFPFRYIMSGCRLCLCI